MWAACFEAGKAKEGESTEEFDWPNIKERTLQFCSFPDGWLVHSTTCFKTSLLGRRLIDGLNWGEGQLCDVSQSPLPLFVCIGSRVPCTVASFQSAHLFLTKSRAYRMGKERMAPPCQDMALLIRPWNTYEVYIRKKRSPLTSHNFGITVIDFKFLFDKQWELSNQRKCPCPDWRSWVASQEKRGIRRCKNRDPKEESNVGSELVSHKQNILSVHMARYKDQENDTFLVLLLGDIKDFVKSCQKLF